MELGEILSRPYKLFLLEQQFVFFIYMHILHICTTLYLTIYTEHFCPNLIKCAKMSGN